VGVRNVAIIKSKEELRKINERKQRKRDRMWKYGDFKQVSIHNPKKITLDNATYKDCAPNRDDGKNKTLGDY
jgi:hypothetical protein